MSPQKKEALAEMINENRAMDIRKVGTKLRQHLSVH